MKRWIHAAQSSDFDWEKKWDPEERWWYWELVTDKGRGIVKFEDDEREGHFNCYIEIPGQDEIKDTLPRLSSAMAYVDSYLY